MKRRDFLLVTGGMAAVGAFPGAASAAACRLFPADGARAFQALHRGEAVGRHRIEFTRDGGDFFVRTDVDIALGGGAAPGYRFVHRAEEVWRGGWLDALVSDTDDDGRLHTLRARRREGIFGGRANGADFTLSGYIIPSSLWHHDTIAVRSLFDTVDGRVKIVRARAVGREEIPVAGKPVPARHYVLSGQIWRELWYDDECRLVRTAFLARHESRIVLEMRP